MSQNQSQSQRQRDYSLLLSCKDQDGYNLDTWLWPSTMEGIMKMFKGIYPNIDDWDKFNPFDRQELERRANNIS